MVVPAFNEAPRIASAIGQIPLWVDSIVVVDDGSTDGTQRVAKQALDARYANASDSRLSHVFAHKTNRGVGAAIRTGYCLARQEGAQIIAVMAGDGQMAPENLPALLNPICDGDADYVKGNRFRDRDVWRVMPKTRLVGNLVLSWATKVRDHHLRILQVVVLANLGLVVLAALFGDPLALT